MKYDIQYPDTFNKSQELSFGKPKKINETMKHMKKYFMHTKMMKISVIIKTTIYLYWKKIHFREMNLLT